MPLQTISGPESTTLAPLSERVVVVVGYGNQGEAHALNMRDSGVDVVVAARAGGPSAERAGRAGFKTVSIEAGSDQADLLIMAVPDEVQPGLFAASIRSRLRRGTIVGFLHGFAVHHKLLELGPDLGVIMVAPKGPGSTLRARYTAGLGLPCLFAIAQQDPDEHAEAVGLAWAHGIGCTRAAVIRTTFAHETETDLFGEQAVLCGGMQQLIRAAFETLVEAGYPPELAYMECCQEVKQVADLVYERGLAGMMDAISNTAEFGAYVAGPRLIDDVVRVRMQSILADIQSGAFADALMQDHARRFPWFSGQRAAQASDPIETAGQSVRAWMKSEDADDA